MWEAEKKAVLETSRRMVESGLAVGTMGNVSVRLKGRDGSDLIAVTPSGCYCDMLAPADIVIVDFTGRTVEGEKKPSSELKLHIAVYQARPEVNAIVHTHSLYGSVLAVIGQKLPAIMDDQVFCLGGEIDVAPYALPGSRQLADNTVAALSTKNAVIIANHGTRRV
jgi:L-fuculose-phosphate aldolase